MSLQFLAAVMFRRCLPIIVNSACDGELVDIGVKQVGPTDKVAIAAPDYVTIAIPCVVGVSVTVCICENTSSDKIPLPS